MKKNKGFTLVELVVSIALLAIILVPVASFFTDSFKVQSKSQLKGAVTRAGQYVVESFKNKEYLKFDELEEWKDAIKVDSENVTVDINTEKKPEKEIEYENISYNVEVNFNGKSNITDLSSMSVPKKFGAEVIIEEDGNIKVAGKFDEDRNIESAQTDFQIDVFEPGGMYIYSTYDGQYYEGKPTIYLADVANISKPQTLKITNYCENMNLGIAKYFEKDLKIFIFGNKNIYFEDGAVGDGRPYSMTRFETVYVGESISAELEGKRGEVLIEADIRVTDTRDESITDIFHVTFPIDIFEEE